VLDELLELAPTLAAAGGAAAESARKTAVTSSTVTAMKTRLI